MHRLLTLSGLILLVAGCAAFNRMQVTQNRHTTIGQELVDLKKAKDQNLISADDGPDPFDGEADRALADEDGRGLGGGGRGRSGRRP